MSTGLVGLTVTEDTPADMLAGAMDLQVILPTGRSIKMSVERSTPMMDLLIHVATANKLSPGGHIIQAVGERGLLPYKPSTAIGTLDTWTIRIIAKKQMNGGYKNNISKPTPFEQTFRLQVHLPRNQLYVTRVSSKTRLTDILEEVCNEKNLDSSKYCLAYADKEDFLDNSKTFGDYKLQQIAIVAKKRLVGLSSADIMNIRRHNNPHINNKYASHSCEESISSGSIEGRSLSPIRSDESGSSATLSQVNKVPNRAFRKRRPAPLPPVRNNTEQPLIISHSRNSSDSSGYHESSVLSESPQSNSLPDSLPRRSKLPSAKPIERSDGDSRLPVNNTLSRSLSNLAIMTDKSLSHHFQSNGIRQKTHSASSTSLASIGGKKKKAPAPPPPVRKPISMSSLEEEGEVYYNKFKETSRRSQTLPSIIKAQQNFSGINTIENLHVAVSHSSLSSVDERDSGCSPSPVADSTVLDSEMKMHHLTNDVYETPCDLPTLDDDEIDRIFNDATKDFDTVSSSSFSSPAHSIRKNNDDDWNHNKLPEPPTAFRDNDQFHNEERCANYNEMNCKSNDTIEITPVIVKRHEEEQTHEISDSCNSSNSSVDINRPSYSELNLCSDSGVGSDNSSLQEDKVSEESLTTIDRVRKQLKIVPRSSTLDNFSITTYQNTKPMEIFHDDSVKTSKTTLIAKSNHPSFKIPTSANDDKSLGLSRHSSFNNERLFAPTIRRSKSYISLLSGNIKSNRLVNHRVNNFMNRSIDSPSSSIADLPSHLSCDEILKPKSPYSHQLPKTLRKTTSSIDVNKEWNLETYIPEKQFSTKLDAKSNKGEINKIVPQLQSLSVLKDIMPKLDKSQAMINSNDNSNNQYFDNGKRLPKKGNESHEYYKNHDGPSVNLKSWNERPKRQVSIKMDKDYVFSHKQKIIHKEEDRLKEAEEIKNANNNKKKVDDNISHVPIVRSVEFKKPFKTNNETGKEIINDNNNYSKPNYIYGGITPYTNNNNSKITFNNKINNSNNNNKINNNNNNENVIFNGDRFKSCVTKRDNSNYVNKQLIDLNKLCKPPPPPMVNLNEQNKFKQSIHLNNNNNNNPRDNLLESIKGFNRDQLKRIKKK